MWAVADSIVADIFVCVSCTLPCDFFFGISDRPICGIVRLNMLSFVCNFVNVFVCMHVMHVVFLKLF